MKSLHEVVTESLKEIKDREEDTNREAFLDALGNYTQAVKDGLIKCGYKYEFKDEYIRIECNNLTAASAFKADVLAKPNSFTMLNIIKTDSQLASRYRKAMMLIQALNEYSLDDLTNEIGEELQILEEKVNEAGKAYVSSRGDGSYVIKSILERILNRLTQGGQISVKFSDINIGYPDDEDIITQACNVNIDVGGIIYTFQYSVPLLSKQFFDYNIASFCASSGLSKDMEDTMKNLYTLKCCLEMIYDHSEVLGDEDSQWYMKCHSDILDLYYMESELLKKFMDNVYLKRPYKDNKAYLFTNA